VFDVAAFDRLHRHLEASGLPIVLSIRPFESALDAEYLANEVPGVRVPPELLERMRRASEGESAANVGVAIAGEVARTLRGSVQGINVIPPHGRFDLGLALLDALA